MQQPEVVGYTPTAAGRRGGRGANHFQERQQQILGAGVMLQRTLQDGDLLLRGAGLHTLPLPRTPARQTLPASALTP